MTTYQPGDGSTPRPDPTVLTTAQLQREVAALKELVFTRIDAMERAVELLHEDTVRIPTDTDKQVGHLKALHDERFESIKLQFTDRDARVAQGVVAQTAAVAAALQAQKELASEQFRSLTVGIEKSEGSFVKTVEALGTSTTRQIEGLGSRFEVAVAALTKQINDGQERLTRIESFGIGRAETREEGRNSNMLTLAVIGGLIALTNLGIGIAVVLSRSSP